MSTTMVTIWLSPTIAADLERRGAFPNLRPENGRNMGGKLGHAFEVTPTLLKQLWDDAHEQSEVRLGGGRAEAGIARAYQSLVRRLRRELPFELGIDAFRWRMSEIPGYADMESLLETAAMLVRLGIPLAKTKGAQP